MKQNPLKFRVGVLVTGKMRYGGGRCAAAPALTLGEPGMLMPI